MKILEVKPTITISDFAKVDIRLGKIEKVEDVPASEKLVKLTVNFGTFTRTILAGIKKERENFKEIKGLQALFVVNLEPKNMVGEVSEGMLIALGYENGIPAVLAIPEKPVENGVSAG